MAAWKEANGVELKPNYIGNHDDIQAKILAGGGSYDLITYYQGYKLLYDELEIITPIDRARSRTSRTSTRSSRGPAVNLWIDPDGTWTGVPWTWGAIGITWNDAELPGGLESWYDLLDPKFKGKIGIVNDPAGLHTLGSHILGYDPAEVTHEQLPEVVDLVSQFVAQGRSIAPGSPR